MPRRKKDVTAEESRDKEAQELLGKVPPSVIGARIRRARLRMGLSIRDLATNAGVSKNSIVRIEQGGVSNVSTILKVSAALGLHVAMLAKPQGDAQVMAVHRHQDSRWYDLTDFGAGPLGGLDRPLLPEERRAFVNEGADTPLLILRSRLETGRLLSTVIELFHESERRSHAGEEFVYVLKGSAVVNIGAQSVTLEEGESVVFYSAEEHSYAPAEGSELPVQVLSVRLDDRPGKS